MYWKPERILSRGHCFLTQGQAVPTAVSWGVLAELLLSVSAGTQGFLRDVQQKDLKCH